MPQENGSHCGCAWVAVKNGGTELFVRAQREFSFNLSHFTQEELTARKHNFELKPSGETVLCLDYRMAGVGSASCGPKLNNCYRICEKQWECSFELTPCGAGEGERAL